MKDKTLWVAIGAAAFGVVYILAAMAPPSDGAMRIHEFGKLPCVADGREKPYDTLARNTLMVISDRQTFYDNEGNKQPAIKWLLDVMAGADEAFNYKVFRIDNLEVLDFLGLEQRSDLKYKFRYAWTEFGDKEEEIRKQVEKLHGVPDGEHSLFQRKIGELWGQLQQFYAILQWHVPHAVPPTTVGGEWQPLMNEVVRGIGADPENRQLTARVGGLVASQKPEFLAERKIRVPFEGKVSEIPVTVGPQAERLIGIFGAYSRGDATGFNTQVAGYSKELAIARGAIVARAGRESFFNDFSPFYVCMVLYVVSFVLVAVGWLRWPVALNRAALWLAVVTLCVHTLALIFRMYLSGRWGVFVTNLYSSAVFIGWGTVGLALLLEWFYRNGLGTVVAAITGFTTLMIAHNLAADGTDTMRVLEAVLDTNFWLATHVTTVTLGYTATFVAGFLGLLYIVGGVLTRGLNAKLGKELPTMIYGTICFAILLSFTGTVLGGIWADQSWGRFWGWDPKENGALMIVLWNGLILHARWGGLVRQRGLAVMAVFGNIVTAWSWFGVNELGAGLHSYGFTEGRAFWLLMFVVSQFVLMAIGLIPLRHWRSFGGARVPSIAPGGSPGLEPRAPAGGYSV